MRRFSSVALALAGLLALTAGKGDTTYEDALKNALAKAGDKPVLVDFGTLW